MELWDESHAADPAKADELLVVRPRRRKKPPTEVDITPMIDITFLLLIFFLVTSKLTQQAGVELPAAKYGDAVATKESVIVTIAQGEGARARIYKGDGVDDATLIVSTDLAAQEDEIVAYIANGLASSAKKKHVLIKAERNVQHREVARVSQAVGRVLDGGQLFVAVMETQ